jgi:hypothetical protein
MKNKVCLNRFFERNKCEYVLTKIALCFGLDKVLDAWQA